MVLDNQRQLLQMSKQLLDIIERRSKQNTSGTTSVNASVENSPAIVRKRRMPTYVQIRGAEIVLGDASLSPPVLISRSAYDEAFYSANNGQGLVLKLLDKLFDKHILKTSSLAGDDAQNKMQLNPRVMSAIYTQIELEFPNYQATKSSRSELRNAINGKCRHTTCKCQQCKPSLSTP